jgi:anti-sigma regulatory factor (Ser/Thr protein kinase)
VERIEQDVDVFAARAAGREAARSAGFGARDAEEIAIVVSELATNILKHGVRGTVTFLAVEEEAAGPGLQIVAADVGPPFVDLETALKDGHDDRGPLDPAHLIRRRGIGAGLGAVHRFTDRFSCEQASSGKRIVVTRYVRRTRDGGRRSA